MRELRNTEVIQRKHDGNELGTLSWYQVEKRSGQMVASLERYEYPFGGDPSDPTDNPPDSSDASEPERPED